MATYTGIGVMSGSSLDGLDVCCVEFTGIIDNDTWGYRILRAKTFPYNKEWRDKIAGASTLNGAHLIQLHHSYSHYVGEIVDNFIDSEDLSVQFVALYGHVVFHKPEHGYTFQLGDGETVATHLNCPLVTNFHNKDVALGGQGTPLVRIGESFLYTEYVMCLNLGGRANLTVRDSGLALDVCFCNTILNDLAERCDPELEYDENGKLAEAGRLIPSLYKRLNDIAYFKESPPKCLGRDIYDDLIMPMLDKDLPPKDLIRTCVEHITTQIENAVRNYGIKAGSLPSDKSILVTGGGALNVYLMKRLQERLEVHGVFITESDSQTVCFKEALIYAFLGLRCLLGKSNVDGKVTGSMKDSISGSIHLPATEICSNPTSRGLNLYGFQMRHRSSSIGESTNRLPPHLLSSSF